MNESADPLVEVEVFHGSPQVAEDSAGVPDAIATQHHRVAVVRAAAVDGRPVPGDFFHDLYISKAASFTFWSGQLLQTSRNSSHAGICRIRTTTRFSQVHVPLHPKACLVGSLSLGSPLQSWMPSAGSEARYANLPSRLDESGVRSEGKQGN